MWIIFTLAALLSASLFIARRQVPAIMILIMLATSCFQLFPAAWFESPLMLNKPFDYAYLAMAIVLMINLKKIPKILHIFRVARLALLYVAFIVLVSIISLLIFSYDLVQIIQSMRIFLWPTFVLYFLLAEHESLNRVTNLLFPAVVVASVLYLQQPITGWMVFSNATADWNPYLGDSNFVRVLATPDFLIFFLLISASRFQGELYGGKKNRLLYFSIMLTMTAVQVITFTRSVLIATAVALANLLFRGRSHGIAVFLSIIFVVGSAGAIISDPYAAQRVVEAIEDVSSTLSGGLLSSDDKYEGNFAFRIAHFYERASYILDDVSRWPIGIGMIHEDSQNAINLGFRVGLLDVDKGRIMQVDSGDIAWSIIIMKTGFIGILLLVYFLFRSYQDVSITAGVAPSIYRASCLYYLITSFFSNSFASPVIMMPLMFFLALALKEAAGAQTNIKTGV